MSTVEAPCICVAWPRVVVSTTERALSRAPSLPDGTPLHFPAEQARWAACGPLAGRSRRKARELTPTEAALDRQLCAAYARPLGRTTASAVVAAMDRADEGLVVLAASDRWGSVIDGNLLVEALSEVGGWSLGEGLSLYQIDAPDLPPLVRVVADSGPRCVLSPCPVSRTYPLSLAKE